MGKIKKTQPAELLSEKTFQYLFLTILLLGLIVQLLAAYWMTPYLWGIHFLYFFPLGLGWMLTIVVIGFFVPPANSFWLKFFESLFSSFANLIKVKKYPLFAIAGLLSLPLFWFLRTKLFLLGDGYLKLDALSQRIITPTEWLDGIIHLEFFRFLTKISPGINPSFSYSILSIMCGGIFVFLILSLSDLLGKTAFQKILIFSSLITLGSIELFFGYVESYSILLVSLTLFILFSVLYLQGKASIIFSFSALVLSVGLHVSAIVFIPAFFYVAFWKWRSGKSKWVDFLTLVSLLGCLGMISFVLGKVFFLKGEGGGFSRFLPLFPSAKTKFTLFSGAHLGEFTNQLFLISPVGTLLFLYFLFYTIKFKSFTARLGSPSLSGSTWLTTLSSTLRLRPEGSLSEGKVEGKDPISNFLLISSLLSLFLIFVYNCHLGNADWDLRSFPGIFFTLFGVLSFIKWGGQWTRFKNYGLILIAVSLFHTVPWILINANTQMSVDRYILTATNDRHLLSTKGGGMWRVGRILDVAGFPEKAEETFKQGIQINPNEMGCYSYLARLLVLQKKYDEAIFYLERALKLDPFRKETLLSLGQIYLKKEDSEKAIFYLDKIKGEHESDSLFVINLATAYMKAQRLKEALNILQGFLAKNQECATMRGLLGAIFYIQKDFPNAKKEWETALELNPDEPFAKTGLEGIRKLEELQKTPGP